jgi:hypothetical protein
VCNRVTRAADTVFTQHIRNLQIVRLIKEYECSMQDGQEMKTKF